MQPTRTVRPSRAVQPSKAVQPSRAAQPSRAVQHSSQVFDDRGDAFDPNCPTRVVLDRIGDKWTVLVVSALAPGTMRFTELRSRIGAVAPKVLTQTLRALERDGILTRRIYAEVPPRVEYSLTDLGRSLAAPIDVIQDWAEEHVGAVVRARSAYDARTD